MRCVCIVLALVALPAHADIEPGNWELSASTSIQGMAQPTSLVQTRCFTAEDARDPSRVFGASPGAPCQFSNRNDTGSLFTFDISCGGEPAMRGSGRVRYGRDVMDAEIELKTDAGPQQIVTLSRIAGRRLGACQ
jgi:hypothetical protein